MWSDLKRAADSSSSVKALLRELGIYGGAQGIWVDAVRTKQVSGDAYGVTVAVLHTGQQYPDELDDYAVLYHYPHTGRPPGRDHSEIEATKNAARLGIPLFVLIDQATKSTSREVRMGWVEAWDDRSELFLISFGERQPASPHSIEPDQPFVPFEDKRRRTSQSAQRTNAQRFRLKVYSRYGRKCAVCMVSVPELIDATHLIPWADGGTDDPRNGLPLCVLHHKALDAGLFAFLPASNAIVAHQGLSKQELMILSDDLSHLDQAPHPEAVRFVWERFKRGEQ